MVTPKEFVEAVLSDGIEYALLDFPIDDDDVEDMAVQDEELAELAVEARKYIRKLKLHIAAEYGAASDDNGLRIRDLI